MLSEKTVRRASGGPTVPIELGQLVPVDANVVEHAVDVGVVAVEGHVCSLMAVRTTLPVPPCSMRWAKASLASDRG